jgi:arsenite methyltransferase
MRPYLTEADIGAIQEGIRRKFAEVANQTDAAQCFQYPTGKAALLQLGYVEESLREIPESVLASFCGVGNPFSLGTLRAGEAVLDIGCGAGVDTLIAARLVGPQGRVVGIDTTPEMVNRARANLTLTGLTNVRFEIAAAEDLPFADREFDVVISNGVFNLTIDTEQALREARRVLKPGGRLMIADMVLVQELPKELKDIVENWCQCIGGALPGKDFLEMLLKLGFGRAVLKRHTGFKSSPYTEGALFYGEKAGERKAEDVIESLFAGLG